MSYLDDWFQGPSGVKGPYYGSGVQATRRNPQTGYTQIQVPDPDHPGQMVWVDALWNPAIDLMVPIDPRYRRPGETYPVDVPWRFNFDGSNNGINFGGPLNLPLPAEDGSLPSQISLPQMPARPSSDNSGVWLGVAALLAVTYLMTR